MYPDDSVQSLTRQWWIEDPSGVPARGRLLWTFVPYPGMNRFASFQRDGVTIRGSTRAPTFALSNSGSVILLRLKDYCRSLHCHFVRARCTTFSAARYVLQSC